MDDIDVEARLQAVEERSIALATILKVRFGDDLPTENERRHLSDRACWLVESAADDSVTEHGRLRMQRIVSQIEGLLGPFSPRRSLL